MKLDTTGGEITNGGVPGLVAGRTVDEQIECIKRTGMHPVTPFLKTELLRALGVPRPKPNAKNLIKFGCYMPFLHPRLVQGYFRLLHLLEVDYTYLEMEYCCCGNTIQTSSGTERERALKAGKKFMHINRDKAREKGAEIIAYICVQCAHFAKAYFPEEAEHHVYAWDLVIDRLEDKALKVEPTLLGYYQGCARRYRTIVPSQVRLDWYKYRHLMNKIEGLTLVNLAKGVCCNEDPERVVQEAIKKDLDTLLSPCNTCCYRINRAAEGRLQVKYLSDILVPALEGKIKARNLFL